MTMPATRAADRKSVVADYISSLKISHIADKHGIGVSTVVKWAQTANAKMRGRTGPRQYPTKGHEVITVHLQNRDAELFRAAYEAANQDGARISKSVLVRCLLRELLGAFESERAQKDGTSLKTAD